MRLIPVISYQLSVWEIEEGFHVSLELYIVELWIEFWENKTQFMEPISSNILFLSVVLKHSYIAI